MQFLHYPLLQGIVPSTAPNYAELSVSGNGQPTRSREVGGRDHEAMTVSAALGGCFPSCHTTLLDPPETDGQSVYEHSWTTNRTVRTKEAIISLMDG